MVSDNIVTDAVRRLVLDTSVRWKGVCAARYSNPVFVVYICCVVFALLVDI